MALWRSLGRRSRAWLTRVLSGEDTLKVGHNLDYEYRWIKHFLGIRLKRVFDTQVAEQVLTMGLPAEHRLAAVAARYLDLTMDKTIRARFIEVGLDNAATYTPTQEEANYAALDAEVVLPIAREQMARIRQEGLARGTKLRMDMLPVVAEMELEGAPLDVATWQSEVQRMTAELERLESALIEQLTPHVVTARALAYSAALEARQAFETAYEAAKALNESSVELETSGARAYDPDGLYTCYVQTKQQRREKINELNRAWKEVWATENGKVPEIPKMEHGPINLGSWQQLQAAYADLGITLVSTEADELTRVADRHPSVVPLLAWKKLKKLEGTYGRPFLEKVVAHDDGTHRIHPSFNLVVSTGRMSCREPNIQNCPPALRATFTAPEGHTFVIADFSQIELRITAELSQDPDMIENYCLGHDLHTTTAARRLGISYAEALERKDAHDEALLAARHLAKTANFRVLYGGQDQELIEVFSSSFPVAWAWIKQQGQIGWTRGWTTTAAGLRRRFANRFPPDLSRAEQWSYRAHIERAAMNAPIQGTSADITMAAAIDVAREVPENRLFNLVHDELDGIASLASATDVARRVKRLSEAAGARYLTRVPVVVETNISRTWSK